MNFWRWSKFCNLCKVSGDALKRYLLFGTYFCCSFVIDERNYFVREKNCFYWKIAKSFFSVSVILNGCFVLMYRQVFLLIFCRKNKLYKFLMNGASASYLMATQESCYSLKQEQKLMISDGWCIAVNKIVFYFIMIIFFYLRFFFVSYMKW